MTTAGATKFDLVVIGELNVDLLYGEDVAPTFRQVEKLGLPPLEWFFLDFGEVVRQAGSREDSLDDRGCPCQTPVPSYPLPSC